MNYQAGAIAYFPFTTRGGSGRQNATGDPVCVLYINGSADGASVSLANPATGTYVASVTIPGGASVGDDIAMLVTATVDGVNDAAWIGRGYVDATISSRSTLTAAGVWDSLLTGITTVGSVGRLIKDNLDAAISSRMETFSYTAPDNVGIGAAATAASAAATSAAAADTKAAAIKAKTDNLPASPADVSNIPTADITAIKTKTDGLPADPASASAIATSFGTVNSNIAALPSATGIATAVWAAGGRTLTGFGSLVTDIAAAVWAAAGRTLSTTADSPGMATLLTRISGVITISGGKVASTLAAGDVAGNLPAQVKGMDTDAITAASLSSAGVGKITASVTSSVPPAGFFVNSPAGGGGTSGLTEEQAEILQRVAASVGAYGGREKGNGNVVVQVLFREDGGTVTRQATIENGETVLVVTNEGGA